MLASSMFCKGLFDSLCSSGISGPLADFPWLAAGFFRMLDVILSIKTAIDYDPAAGSYLQFSNFLCSKNQKWGFLKWHPSYPYFLLLDV